MMPVAILVGGLATRLYPVTRRKPKSMIMINGKPFIEYQIELLKKNGIENIVLCIGNLGEQIRDYVRDGKKWGVEVSYSFDGPELLGTGCAIKKALHLLGKEFGVLYGDSYLDIDYKYIMNTFKYRKRDGLMTLYHDPKNANINMSSSLYEITRYDKNSRPHEMCYVDYGFSVFRENAFTGKNLGMNFDLAIVCQYLIMRNALIGYEIFKPYQEIGSKEGLKKLRMKLYRKAEDK